MTQIAIALFDRYTALDALGPYSVLAHFPDAELFYVAERSGPIQDDRGALTIDVQRSFDEVDRPDIVVVPGGFVTRLLVMTGDPLIEWVQRVHPFTTWTTSVCTGSLLLGKAGLLDGLTATTNWTALEDLRAFGAIPSEARYVVHPEQRIVTAAGVSAGIDMALRLAGLVHGDEVAQRIQLGLEYDPQPPYDSGSPAKAPAHIVADIRARVAVGKERFREMAASRPSPS